MSGNNHRQLLERVCRLPQELEPLRELLLANVVMISEIPAPTFSEEKRIAFIKQRFTECGLSSVSTDEAGNGVGLLPGKVGDRTLLLVAHADTPFNSSENHTCTVEPTIIRGPGVADNSLGVAVLATLPTLLERLGLQLQCDMLLMASTQSLEQGDQQGLRYFLQNYGRRVSSSVLIEGSPLGRLQYRSMASLGGMITCRVHHSKSQVNAIELLNRVISQLGMIALPEWTQTALVLGSISGGASYKVPARNARLRFQLRSDSDDVVREVTEQISSLCLQLGEKEGVSAELKVIARTTAGGLVAGHPLVAQACRVLGALNIEPGKITQTSTVSACVEQNIPAICIGISNGENINYADEYVEIGPILRGVAQLIGVILSMDGGYRA
jgi:acetylornithine deacetylase/succinyl-diaminopimelate desuccinylase-like protein